MSFNYSYAQMGTHPMTAEGVSLILAGIAAAVASLVYSCRNVRHSECCGSRCDQRTQLPTSKLSFAQSTEI